MTVHLASQALARSRRRFVELRGARSQRAFARELGVTWAMLAHYEQGGLPSPTLLIRLGQSGVRLDWLIFGEGPATWVKPRRDDYQSKSLLDFEPWEVVEL